MENSKNARSNLWCCVVYPGDSLPKKYMKIIQNFHVPVLLSPVHDADKNGDETEKKKHIHVMFDFGSGQNKSFAQVQEYTKQLKGTIPKIVHSRSAMIRYFIHKDNPEKSQRSKGMDRDWEVNDLVLINGFEIKESFENFTSEQQLYKFIENIIYDNFIYNYAVLCKYMDHHGYQYELNFLRRHTVHFKALLDGQWQLLKTDRMIFTDSKSDIDEYVNIVELKKPE